MGRFLCAKALQQTHILPAKLMLSTSRTPKTKRKGFPGGETASERDTAATMTQLISVEVVGCFRSKSYCHRLMINNMTFMDSHFSFCQRSYRWLSASVLCFSLSHHTDSTEWGNLPTLTEHRPSTFHSLWAVFQTKVDPG